MPEAISPPLQKSYILKVYDILHNTLALICFAKVGGVLESIALKYTHQSVFKTPKKGYRYVAIVGISVLVFTTLSTKHDLVSTVRLKMFATLCRVCVSTPPIYEQFFSNFRFLKFSV